MPTVEDADKAGRPMSARALQLTEGGAARHAARLQAHAALHGITLRQLPEGGWLACRWNLTRTLSCREIDAWLTVTTGSRP
jgi:hypothetical protein